MCVFVCVCAGKHFLAQHKCRLGGGGNRFVTGALLDIAIGLSVGPIVANDGREAVTERCHALPGRVVCGLGVRGMCARRWKVASGQ